VYLLNVSPLQWSLFYVYCDNTVVFFFFFPSCFFVPVCCVSSGHVALTVICLGVGDRKGKSGGLPVLKSMGYVSCLNIGSEVFRTWVNQSIYKL